MKKLFALSFCLTALMITPLFAMEETDSQKGISKKGTHINGRKKNPPHSGWSLNMLEDTLGLISGLVIFYELAIVPALQSAPLQEIGSSLPEMGFFDPIDMIS